MDIAKRKKLEKIAIKLKKKMDTDKLKSAKTTDEKYRILMGMVKTLPPREAAFIYHHIPDFVDIFLDICGIRPRDFSKVFFKSPFTDPRKGKSFPRFFGWGIKNIKIMSFTPEKRKTRTVDKSKVIDRVDGEDDFILTLELPGVRKDDFIMRYEDDYVRIATKEGADRKYRQKISVPSDVQKKSARARYKNGILVLTFKKKKPAKK